ncbi:MAG: hypothetical protein WBA98_03740 [Gordonia sp. (in: high G+C Gram-positive bacteria)]|uniref:hypothetical protein n=1 Tax=Gordonia sp. (in: high G+C Gram-positive bacteria) TaxID=84139 RepID=UPI003C709D31
MTTIRVPVDPIDAMCDDLQALLSAMDEFDDVTVSPVVPPNWSPTTGPRLLLVESDGTPSGVWPVATTVTVRLTAWTHGRDTNLLATVLGLLLSGHPIAGAARVKPGTWPLAATDSTTHASLNSATVRVTVRTEEKDF